MTSVHYDDVIIKKTHRRFFGYVAQALQVLTNGIGGSMDLHSGAVIAVYKQMILTLSRIVYTRIWSVDITLEFFFSSFKTLDYL